MRAKIELTRDTRKNIIEELKRFFLNERKEEIPDPFAEILLDFVINNIGPHIYNHAIEDAYTYINEKVEDLFELKKTLT